MASELSCDATSAPSLGVFDRLARRILASQLHGLRRGELRVTDPSGTAAYGEWSDVRANLHVHRPAFFREAVLGGTLAVAESYMRGDWDCDDLTALFRIFARNSQTGDQLERGITRVVTLGHRLFHWWRANSRLGSQRNIHEHYDLGNDFFRLWLDDTLAYSSGIFRSSDVTLRDASVEKFDRVCRKLDLQPGDELLEIGTGWGGFALHAAENYDCRVTTTTISRAQHDVARGRFEAAGVADRVTLLCQDYRDLTGSFDKLVSIEMIEAVGHRYLDSFFGQCGRLLRPDGSLVLQAIVMPEGRYAQYLRSVDFIQRYIFPGGCLPSLAAMLESAGRATDLRFVHAEDFAPHYAETLRRWRREFAARESDVRALGYSERFLRMWHYYLCYCEAAFEERCIGVLQVQFDKPECRRDPGRLSDFAARRDSSGLMRV